jgi:hypothetical protein
MALRESAASAEASKRRLEAELAAANKATDKAEGEVAALMASAERLQVRTCLEASQLGVCEG